MMEGDDEEAYGRDLYYDIPIPPLEPDPDDRYADPRANGAAVDQGGFELDAVYVSERGRDNKSKAKDEADSGDGSSEEEDDDEHDEDPPELEPDDDCDDDNGKEAINERDFRPAEDEDDNETEAPRETMHRGQGSQVERSEQSSDPRHPFQEYFQPPPNFFPKKNFTCDAPAPTVEELQKNLEHKYFVLNFFWIEI